MRWTSWTLKLRIFEVCCNRRNIERNFRSTICETLNLYHRVRYHRSSCLHAICEANLWSLRKKRSSRPIYLILSDATKRRISIWFGNGGRNPGPVCLILLNVFKKWSRRSFDEGFFEAQGFSALGLGWLLPISPVLEIIWTHCRNDSLKCIRSCLSKFVCK